MKRLPSVNVAKALVAGYVDTIEIPRYRAADVRARISSFTGKGRAWPRVPAAIAAAVAAVVLVAFAPAVVAQVQRVMQAFTIVNGRPTQVPVQEVSLEQLRADMPFAVVVPASVPANLHEVIQEIGTGSSAHATFLYSAAGGPPMLTIMESSAADRSSSNLTMLYGAMGKAPLPGSSFLPPAQTSQGTRTSMIGMRSGAPFHFRVTPITWIARGTRITLIAVPGAFDRLQLNAILRAMRS